MVSRKNLNTCTNIGKAQQYMYTKELIWQSSKKCEISKAMDGIEDLSQVDSFDSSDNNFEDYSRKKVQESFRKHTRGHPSYF